MEAATKVGKIFSKAGEEFHNLASMTAMLDPAAAEIHAIDARLNAKAEQAAASLLPSASTVPGNVVHETSTGTVKIVMKSSK